MWSSCIETLYDDLYNDCHHTSLNFSYYFPLVSKDVSGPLPSCISALAPTYLLSSHCIHISSFCHGQLMSSYFTLEILVIGLYAYNFTWLCTQHY